MAARLRTTLGARRAVLGREGVQLRVSCTESDEVLAERAKVDREVFGVLYERHVRRIYTYIYYRTGNAADAEDLTARTFYQALGALPRYRVQGAPFTAWLFRIAHNLLANWHRDNGRRRIIPLDGIADLPNPRDDPAGETEAAEERRKLRCVIAQLPVDRQQLLVLKFAEQMPNAQIAAIMGRSEGAIKALLHRTIANLRDQLSTAKAGGR